jgi:hypothetical protein
MPHSDLRTPYGLLIFGVFLLFLGVGGTCTGEAWGHFDRQVHRDEEPKRFWWLVASQYIGGLGLLDTSCIRSMDFKTENCRTIFKFT